MVTRVARFPEPPCPFFWGAEGLTRDLPVEEIRLFDFGAVGLSADVNVQLLSYIFYHYSYDLQNEDFMKVIKQKTNNSLLHIPRL